MEGGSFGDGVHESLVAVVGGRGTGRALQFKNLAAALSERVIYMIYREVFKLPRSASTLDRFYLVKPVPSGIEFRGKFFFILFGFLLNI